MNALTRATQAVNPFYVEIPHDVIKGRLSRWESEDGQVTTRGPAAQSVFTVLFV